MGPSSVRHEFICSYVVGTSLRRAVTTWGLALTLLRDICSYVVGTSLRRVVTPWGPALSAMATAEAAFSIRPRGELLQRWGQLAT